jgi:hypothetical protein
MTHDKTEKAFRTHLSRIHKAGSLSFYKLAVGSKVLSTQQEIADEMSQTYSQQFQKTTLMGTM